MKIQIKYLSLLFFVSLLAFSTCNKDNDLNNDGTPDYVTFCDDLNGGDFNITFEGENWSTNCVEAIYSETVTVDYEQKYLYVYAYNYGGTYFADTDIEVAYVIWIETTVGTETSVVKGAGFYKGFYDYSQAINNPDYEVEDLVLYASKENSASDIINITEINSNTVTGNLSFKLFEDVTNAEVTMSGDFTANITQ